MLVRVESPDPDQAAAIFAQMVRESPHPHTTLKYKPKG